MSKRRRHCNRSAVAVAGLLAAQAWAQVANAQSVASDAGVRRGAEAAFESTAEHALPPLPEIPRLELSAPTAEEVQELDQKLAALFSDERDTAIGELVEVRSRMVSAIHARLSQLADRSDKERLKRILADARRQLPSERRSSSPDSPGARHGEGDLLTSLLLSEKAKEQATRECIQLLALFRMLSAMSNVEAARELIFAYSRFGEFVRVEVQRRLSEMKDRSIAALIEARRHPAEKISRWAALRLDQIGKAIPGESVRTNDFDALADILRAYGRVRDPDAARLIVSFANSERGQLRLAARQSIALLGPVGLWQLRDAYEDVVGRKPRRDWSWERTARELFGEFDRLRLARVYGTFMEGMQGLEKGDLQGMARAFDLVLAKDPLFEKRAQMADGYLKFALSEVDRNPEAASLAAIRAERLAIEPKLRDQARSLIVMLRALESERHGLLDMARLKNANELDPTNKRARELLAAAQNTGAGHAQSNTFRWLTSAAIGAVGLLSVLIVLLRRAKRDSDSSSSPPAPTQPS